MLNEILHRLTNKARDPSVTGFPTDSLFVPTNPDEFETNLREVLRVNEDEFYVRAYIQFIHAFPELLTALGERERTFNPGRTPSTPGEVFPLSTILAKLALSKGLIPVLRKAGLLNHYHWAESGEERIAVTAAALCLYNKLTSN